MKGFRTSYVGMFGDNDTDAPRVDSIEIPLIQRDYAQGRRDAHADDVRDAFLDALHTALTVGPPVGLDFVYGEARDGTFEPLDGQQRLTTLFLLHWYLAFRTGNLSASLPWTRLTYATRPSARRFCAQLVANPPAAGFVGPPSDWITDQSWYLHLWRFDPTVGAMLVMIDAIAERFAGLNPESAWVALTDAVKPAVWFQLLPVADMGAADDLYIKMNSRGKPLTAFEAFKAHFGQVIEHTGRTAEFGERIDGPWADLLWPYRGDNDIVDDEFMRYFDFVLEVCEWREGQVQGDEQRRLERRAEALFSSDNNRHAEHLDFVFDAFDRWPQGLELESLFESLFDTAGTGSALRLFGATSPNLFLACCDRYGLLRGNTRAFSLTDTLLLYAVLIHRIEDTDHVAERLRVLRNVNEASQFEMRVQNMPKFVAEVAEFMRTGDLAALATYNQNQILDEQRKRDFRALHPEHATAIARLEDHPILRGTLAAFDLDVQLPGRTETFEQAFEQACWPTLTAALVATGEYQRDYPNSDYHLFGSPTTESVWRALLVDRGDRTALARTGAVVTQLLENLAEGTGSVPEGLERVVDAFLEDRQAVGAFDWRYYLASYGSMREGRSGIYYGADHALGYEMTMLDKTVQRSYYRDPYLYAMWREAGSPAQVKDPWFYGYSTEPRWMRFTQSGVELRSTQMGIAIRSGIDEYDAKLASMMAQRSDVASTEDGFVVMIPQTTFEGALADARDRVLIGAELLADLVEAEDLVPPSDGRYMDFQPGTKPDSIGSNHPTGDVENAEQGAFITRIVELVQPRIAETGLRLPRTVNTKQGVAIYRLPDTLVTSRYMDLRVIAVSTNTRVEMFIQEAGRQENYEIAELLRTNCESLIAAYGIRVDDWHKAGESTIRERVSTVVGDGFATGDAVEIAREISDLLTGWVRLLVEHPITGIEDIIIPRHS